MQIFLKEDLNFYGGWSQLRCLVVRKLTARLCIPGSPNKGVDF